MSGLGTAAGRERPTVRPPPPVAAADASLRRHLRARPAHGAAAAVRRVLGRAGPARPSSTSSSWRMLIASSRAGRAHLARPGSGLPRVPLRRARPRGRRRGGLRVSRSLLFVPDPVAGDHRVAPRAVRRERPGRGHDPRSRCFVVGAAALPHRGLAPRPHPRRPHRGARPGGAAHRHAPGARDPRRPHGHRAERAAVPRRAARGRGAGHLGADPVRQRCPVRARRPAARRARGHVADRAGPAGRRLDRQPPGPRPRGRLALQRVRLRAARLPRPGHPRGAEQPPAASPRVRRAPTSCWSTSSTCPSAGATRTASPTSSTTTC